MPAYKNSKNMTWFSKFYYTNNEGKKKQKWKRGFKTKREALEYEREFLAKANMNCGLTFSDLADIYFTDMKPRLRETTYDTKIRIFKCHILPYYDHRELHDITPAEIRKWQGMMSEKNLSSTYLKAINNQLSSIFNYAVRFYGLSTNPCRIAGSIGSSKAGEMKYWSINEYMIFRDAIKDKPHSFISFEILFWTGIREGELLALTPADINLSKHIISINKTYTRLHGKDIVNPPKTQKSLRNVPIPDFLSAELGEYLSRKDIRKEERIIPYTDAFLFHEMKRGCAKSGVKVIRIHDIRHSHASLLIGQGFDIVTISKRLGHENVSTTLNIYSHMLPHKQDEIIEALEKINQL